MSTKAETRLRPRGGARSAAVVRGAEWFIRFLLGAVLSGSEVFGGAAPFGLGFIAASGSGVGGFSALLGVCFGYISFQGLTASLRYLASAILIFSVSFAFYDLRVYRTAYFMPATATLFSACTGFIYLAAGDWSGRQTVLFLSELTLTAASAYFYRVAFSPWERREGAAGELPLPQLVSRLILGGTVLIALARLQLPGDISVGRLAASAAVMTLAYLGGPGYGAAGGIAAGIAMDFAVSGLPYYGMAFSLSGLMAGVFHRQGRLFAALSYVLANAVAVLWTWDMGVNLPLLYEVFIASVLFLLLPERLLRRAAAAVRRDAAQDGGAGGTARAQERLAAAAEAFREVCRSIRPALNAPLNDGDAVSVFDCAAERVCRTCALRETCWQREYQDTRDACNHALPLLLDRGRCAAGDFSEPFRSRCVRLPAFLAAADEALSALLQRRQYKSRLRESRRAVCRQYEDLAALLGSTAAELAAELTPDPGRTKRLRAHLERLNLEGEAAVFYDEAQRLRAEVAGRGLSVLADEAARAQLAAVLGVPLGSPDIVPAGDGERVTFLQAEPYMAVAGVAARRRDGETTSGDAGTWFKRPDGMLYVLLCDGMGSGEAALAESSLAVRLLEKFLRAGVPPEGALRTLNSAMVLRDEAAGAFSTVDLLAVSLVTGEGAVYKFGAAPTFLKRKSGITKLAGASLPAGLMDGDGIGPDIARFQVAAGDCAVLLSDGVTADGEAEVRRKLTAFDGVSPKDLACALIAGNAADDRTAIVLQIKARE